VYDRPEVALLDDALASHRATRFGMMLTGPMRRRDKRFGVVTFEPYDPAGPTLYLSTAITRGTRSTSFFALADRPARGHVETLTLMAWRHLEGTLPPLQAGTVVPIGRPWLPRSPLSWVLVSPPYPLGPSWPELQLPSGRWDLLWAQPITSREAQYARGYGVEALQRRFSRAGIRFTAGHRDSVV